MLPVRVGCDHLLYNEACLKIYSSIHRIPSLWVQSVDCELCDFVNVIAVIKDEITKIAFEATTKWNLQLNDSQGSSICIASQIEFSEHGIYVWNTTVPGYSDIHVVYAPDSSFVSWIFALVAFLLIVYIWRSSVRIYTYGFHLKNLCYNWKSAVQVEIESDLGNPIEHSNDVVPLLNRNAQGRIKCLDVFRGVTVALMIFVNTGGGRFWYFEHSVWNGVTIADCVFPWFAWIMGVSISMKVKSELRARTSRKDLFYRVGLRSLTLIVLGVILSNLNQNDLRRIRLTGVLQRLGISYLIVASLETFFMYPELLSNQPSRFSSMKDIVACKMQWFIVLSLVAVHTLITFYLPVPNCPTGYVGPGGLHDHGNYYQCTGGAAGYLDKLIIGTHHMYKTPTCQKYYDCPAYDAEGLLGVLTTVLCVYLGVQTGVTMLLYRATAMRIKRWMLWSLLTVVLGAVLSRFPMNDGLIPLNKNLWSLSYVLVTCGFAFLLISLLYFLIDDKKLWSGTPFYQAGMNALLLYALHEIFCDTFPWKWKAFNHATHTEYLLMNLWATFLWIFTAVVLYEYKFFITI